MIQALKKRIQTSMGLKFVITLSGWIAVLMLIGTVFVARMFMVFQQQALEAKAREMGTVLGKSLADKIVLFDTTGLNAVVTEVIAAGDYLSIVVVNAVGTPLTSASASFDHADPEVQRAVEGARTEDVITLFNVVRQELDAVTTSTDILSEGTKLGELRMAISRSAVRANTGRIVALLLGTAVLIVVTLSGLVYFMVRRMIAGPAQIVQAAAATVASGDLTHTVQIASRDEIGHIADGLNQMIVGLRGLVGNIRSTARKLEAVSTDVAGVSANVAASSTVQSESVEEAASSVNEMHYSLKEIAGSVDDLNTTTEQTTSAVIETAASIDEVARTMSDLSSSIEETSTAITQMSAAITSTAENVSSLSGLIDETSATATEVSASVREVEANALQSVSSAEAVTADAQQLGMRSIEKTIDGMRRIEEETQRSAEVINRLGQRAESIGGILTVIEDITDQTSLLALNAAILAAQAGEHGKGFAVVAAEIRELANRTATSTKEIAGLIASVQEETREAVDVMQKNVMLAADGMLLANDAGDGLRKILARAEESRAMSHSISRAAAEQARGMRRVSEALSGITERSHQIAHATAEQRGGSEQIMRAAEKMREITRFVRSATAEQVKASSDISSAVEKMSTKVGLVHRASEEVRAGSDLIVKAIERIKATARENADLAARLNSSVEVMTAQTASLTQEIGRFSTGGSAS